MDNLSIILHKFRNWLKKANLEESVIKVVLPVHSGSIPYRWEENGHSNTIRQREWYSAYRRLGGGAK